MKYFSLVLLLLTCHLLVAQEESTLPNRVNVVFGVGQIVQGGFNAEANLFLNRLVFDYSHGISLNLYNDQLEEGDDKAQGLDIRIPWTTGFGLGYRFNDWLNLRVEPKWHRFELMTSTDGEQARNTLGEYTTFTLGLGLYANWMPFKNKSNILKGLMIAPNIRWWPRVSSTLEDNTLQYYNSVTEKDEQHQARQIGINNSPFFYNISIGYSFKF